MTHEEILRRKARPDDFETEIAADTLQWAVDEIGRLRAALKPFCEADWYADGHGRFDGKIAGADLDRAKAEYQQLASQEKPDATK